MFDSSCYRFEAWAIFFTPRCLSSLNGRTPLWWIYVKEYSSYSNCTVNTTESEISQVGVIKNRSTRGSSVALSTFLRTGHCSIGTYHYI